MSSSPEKTSLHEQSQQSPRQSFSRGSFDTATQQALLQAYIQAVRSGQIPMPGLSASNVVAKAQKQANHNRTISDAKKGVTYAGQDQLKHLPIPNLEETCQSYLAAVRPFLVFRSEYGCLICRVLGNSQILKM
jgi:hypothetical protein